jgi:tRNA G18 (ribose-2'-O)-methylase SpoU
MRIARVDDPADPRLADYRDLKDGAARRRAGILIAETRAVVARLLASGRHPVRSVLTTESGLAALDGPLRRAPAEMPVYVASLAVMRAAAGFDVHRGCLAAADRGLLPDAPSLIAPAGPRVLVALEEIADPDNVGAIFRNALAFGAAAALLSPGAADPLYRKAIRVSVGATLTLPFARAEPWTALPAALRAAGYRVVALTPDPGAADLGALAGPGARVALLLGNEGAGLRPETLAASDVRVRIPITRAVDSLNVATAAGIALHWATRCPAPGTRTRE